MPKVDLRPRVFFKKMKFEIFLVFFGVGMAFMLPAIYRSHLQSKGLIRNEDFGRREGGQR